MTLFKTLALALAALTTVQALAQETPPAPTALSHPLDKASAEAFFDGLVPVQLARSKIAGATIALVKDDEVLLVKGYGLADVAGKSPVTPETLFRIGSISKTFIALAAMQLVEQGKLDLDRDVADYVGFTFPAPADAVPVTMRRLMTHRAGFAETVRELFLPPSATLPEVRDYLITHVPTRLHPDGQVGAYSNYGAALAAHVVERVSGQSFAAYARDHLFKPLDLPTATFEQRLPSGLQALMSKGYTTRDGQEIPFEVAAPYPAGSVSASANDMARYMQALLAGKIPGLSAETFDLIMRDQVQTPAGANAQGLFFYASAIDKNRMWGHGGDTIAFHSDMALLPDQKIGLFVSYNSASGGATERRELMRLFIERFSPKPATITPIAGAADQAKALAGTWTSSRRADDTRAAFASLASQTIITALPDGGLQVEGARDQFGNKITHKPVAPGQWRADPFVAPLTALPDADGVVRRLVFGFPAAQLQRVAWYDAKGLVVPVIGLSLLVLVLMVVAPPVNMILRAYYDAPRPRPRAIDGRLSWGIAFVVALAQVAMVAIGAVFFIQASANPAMLGPANDMVFHAIAALGLFAIAGLVPMVLSGFGAWARTTESVFARFRYSLVVVASLLVSAFAVHWHLIGFSLRY